MTPLGVAVRGVLRDGVEAYRDSPQATAWLRQHLARFEEPLRVAIAGKVKAGKSTLLNALVGEEIAPTDAGECTRVVTWYQDGPSPKVLMIPREGRPRPLTVARRDGALTIDLGGTPAERVDRLVVDWPSQSLRTTSLIDTPGIASMSADTSARAGAFLVPEDAPAPADAVLYLMRHLHVSDVRFLESFHDQGVAKAAPVNTVAILSRADEIGVGRLDAMASARQIAGRYRRDDKLRSLCQTVVAVAGLLAQSGRTMRQAEFTALATLAKAEASDTEPLLLSADRFVRASETAPLDPETRAALLDRFGLFGVRLGITLIRRGTDDPGALSAELVKRSGLDELRTVLTTQFTERRDLLKSRSALLALELVLAREPIPASVPLAREVERITAGAHEFTELRLLTALRTRVVTLPKDVRVEAERLLGGDGGTASARLGLEPSADPAQLREAALAALGGWQRRAESPLSDRSQVGTARTLVRTCEGLLASLPR
ncbi:dynamin family protein [Pseudonocardia sp. KRD-184]|uniref:Dynamin family protein n=1 Tax=Pseudonocardia oceani TaxID=2792013 RepID=A0ABS6UA87_9PSEU|nr:dynamin family protein [Pseudonocardia oceani]MBW0088815.1 dynamin family protein [Pseudonocardia oceani]MBW0097515.1 dynamin family protein [Pseudonocardia oceani]MBW0110121.1 dynamin family protein [Pseudonocardia oceani]MBW0122353.1 dynamin family protein [Pseudonocardia oceani]MBW0129156.1 dynamin family protein [Pseudonocardia oceani]